MLHEMPSYCRIYGEPCSKGTVCEFDRSRVPWHLRLLPQSSAHPTPISQERLSLVGDPCSVTREGDLFRFHANPDLRRSQQSAL